MFDNDQPEYAGIRPPGQLLMLLVRAAVADDGYGGPWLTVMRASTPDTTPVYTHRIVTRPIVGAGSQHRLVMLSGDEALAHAADRGWASITDPTARELRTLGTYACQASSAALWRRDYVGWLADYCAADRREQLAVRADIARGAARGLRWMLAEQWLRATPE